MPFESYNPNTQERIELNQIRFVCNDGDKRGIHVKSTLNGTYKLDEHTDESISFTDDDLVAIKNCLERPCEILLESIRLPRGRRAILKPARQPLQTLVSTEISSTRSSTSLILGPGETCMMHSSLWSPQGGQGRRMLA